MEEPHDTTQLCPKPVVVLILSCEVISCKSRSMNNSVTHVRVATSSRLHTQDHDIAGADNTQFTYNMSSVSLPPCIKSTQFLCLNREMSSVNFYCITFNIEILFLNRVKVKISMYYRLQSSLYQKLLVLPLVSYRRNASVCQHIKT